MHFKFVSLYNVLVLLDSLDFLYYRDKQAKKNTIFFKLLFKCFYQIVQKQAEWKLKNKTQTIHLAIINA